MKDVIKFSFTQFFCQFLRSCPIICCTKREKNIHAIPNRVKLEEILFHNPQDIGENNDRMLQLAVDFTDRIDRGDVLHDDTVQEASNDVRQQLDILRNGANDADYLTSRQALHEIQAGRTRQVLEIAIAELPQPIDEMTLTALRSIIETVMQSLATAD